MAHRPATFQASRRAHSVRHAHVAFHSNLVYLLVLTLAFLYLNWCFQGLKRRSVTERLAGHPHLGGRPAAAAAHAGGLLFSWGLDANFRLGRQDGNAEVPQTTLEELEVVDVAASRHSLLVTRSGAVWSMGANDSSGGGGHGSKALRASGQLGRDGGWAPGRVLGALQGQTVRHVAAGRYHSVAVTDDGRVLTWGLNDKGQLGRGGTRTGVTATAGQQQSPAVLTLPGQDSLANGPAATAVAGGANAPAQSPVTLAATAGATASSMDPSGSSSCTSGWSCHDGLPGLVEALQGVAAVAVSAGRYSTVVLDSLGQLWVWGYDGCASSGDLPGAEEMWRPRLVQGQLKGRRVAAVDVGYSFWLAATQDGALFSCDTQDDGYAGTLPEARQPNNAGQLGRSGPPHEPGQVLGALQHERVVAVAAGREHAVVATLSGKVYSFGGGRAVLGREGPSNEPGLVAGALRGQVVKRVAAGEYFSLAATGNAVYGWGSNAYLCTGTGAAKDKEVLEPEAVAGVLGSRELQIYAVAAGYQLAFAVADHPSAAAAAKLRPALVRADAHGLRASAVAPAPGVFIPVQVVLTKEQMQAQEQYQRAEQVAAAATAALNTPLANQAKSSIGDVASAAAGPGSPSLNTSSSSSESASSPSSGSSSSDGSSPSSPGLSAADYHSSYLALQPAPSSKKASEVWTAWVPSPWHDALAALSPDVFQLLPKEYNPMNKNPCFGVGPQLACLPYFNIIGVSKCGTTDLYHRLTLYKQAILPATNKGPHFWDECPFPPKGKVCQAGPSGDFQAYINLFSIAADLIRARPQAITGEASSNTFTAANGIYLRGFKGDMPMAQWAGALGANATMPALLREAQPYLRLILLLRSPVNRYYSAFHYYRWWLKEDRPPTADDFHEVAVKEVKQWTECVAARGVDDCLRHFQPQQLIKGMYAKWLPDWLRHWPREQLLILRYEDYIAALPQHLQAVLRFLGVPEPDQATQKAMATADVVNKKPYPAMRPDTRQLLEDFYAPFNKELASSLNDQRWMWDGA